MADNNEKNDNNVSDDEKKITKRKIVRKKPEASVKKEPEVQKQASDSPNKKERKLIPPEMMSYILGIAAILFAAIILITDEEQLAYKIVTAPLRHLFGGCVFIIPLYGLILAFMWRKHRQKYSVFTVVSLTVLSFIFAMVIWQSLHTVAKEFDFSAFWNTGNAGSGIIGGTITWGLVKIFSKPVTIIITALLFIVSLIFLLGTTPGKLFVILRDKEKAKRDERRDERRRSARERAADDKAEMARRKAEAEEKARRERDEADIAVSEEKSEAKKNESESDDEAKKKFEPKIFGLGLKKKNVDMSIKSESDYKFPPFDILAEPKNDVSLNYAEELRISKEKLEETLEEYKIDATIVNTCCGPTVTRYELEPGPGVRVKTIASHADDIALRLAATSIRVEAPIPGKAAVGLEIPNSSVTLVRLRELLETETFRKNKSKMFVCLGKDVAGEPVYFDIAKMPHLLIAGATGMGKSVCINCIIVSLLYRARPDEVKLILIDPKKIEFSDYEGIPHLLVPVVTEPKKAAGALNWAVNEMEKRFELFKEVGARDLREYNELIIGDEAKSYTPRVVIVIDELADLMMTAPDEVEGSICRIAQKARAAGMHLIIGTQRPSVNVITGLIKANIPSRIAFTVASQIDARTILDIAGAEKLLGRGDMLYSPVGTVKPLRVQGAFIDGQKEVGAVCAYLRSDENLSYNNDIMKQIEEEAKRCGQKSGKRGDDSDDKSEGELDDPLLIKALDVAFEFGTISTSLLQRRLSVGYGRASKIVDYLQDKKYVSEFDPATKKRKVLISMQEYQELKYKSTNE